MDPKIKELYDQAIEEIKTCYDPEIPVNIYELGLIYDLTITPITGTTGDSTAGQESAAGKEDSGKEPTGYKGEVIMTLTSPFCPVAGTLPEEVKEKVLAVEEITEATVDVVFDPPWDKEMMSEEAKLQLGFM